MKKANRSFNLDTVPVLLIFCVFAISALMVLAFGAGIYERTVDITGESYEEQTCLSYIWTKVKSSDTLEKVYIDTFHDLPALCIEEELDGVLYKTMIYQYDGWVRELFFEYGLEFLPNDGLQVVEADSLTFERAGNDMIKVTAGEDSILLALRSKTYERSRQE